MPNVTIAPAIVAAVQSGALSLDHLIPAPLAIGSEDADARVDPFQPIQFECGTPARIDAVQHLGGFGYPQRVLAKVAFVDGQVPARCHSWRGWSYYDLATGRCDGDTSQPSIRNIPAPIAPVVRFEVRAGVNGTDRDDWSCVSQFGQGKEAADWVKANRAAYGDKSLAIVRVEAVPAPVDWRARETDRLASGAYAPLPGDWSRLVAASYPDHFAHISQSDKRKVAFTETEASGERDKQKVLTATAYVDRFFAAYGERWWSEDTRTRFVADMLGDSVKPLIAPLGDVEAMVRVYRDTSGGAAHGCMSGPAHDYSCGEGVHPVSVYALGGEITIAFLRGCEGGDDAAGGLEYIDTGAAWDGSGPVLTRCLVWEKGKEYGRVYGETVHARMLRTALEAMGYRSGDLQGARIAKLPTARGVGYVMPYLDIGGGCFDDCGEYFTAGGDLCGTSTSGVVDGAPEYTCDHCGDSEAEEDMRTVYVGRYDAENWCEHCSDHNAFFCEVIEESVADSCGETYFDYCDREQTCASWALTCGIVDGAVECSDGVWRVNADTCADCSTIGAIDDMSCWDGRDTGAVDHSDEDWLCSDCHDERERMADEVAEASPELPLDAAA
jgi:hypothetical protein